MAIRKDLKFKSPDTPWLPFNYSYEGVTMKGYWIAEYEKPYGDDENNNPLQPAPPLKCKTPRKHPDGTLIYYDFEVQPFNTGKDWLEACRAKVKKFVPDGRTNPMQPKANPYLQGKCTPQDWKALGIKRK